ncbi:hypothetical protein MM5_001 [Morganella phage vB_Mm5]
MGFKSFIEKQSSQYDENVTILPSSLDESKTDKVGWIKTKEGAEYNVFKADSTDMKHFGKKNLFRIKGNNGTSVAIIDWKSGTVAFNAGDSSDEHKFSRPVKFKKGNLFEGTDTDDFKPLSEVKMSELQINEIYRLNETVLVQYTGKSRVVGSDIVPSFHYIAEHGVVKFADTETPIELTVESGCME